MEINIENQKPKIFRCSVGFYYTNYYIEVILLAINKTDAKKKFISKCLEKYDKIITIDFEQYYDSNEHDKLPLNFNKNNIKDFEKWLYDNINENDDDDDDIRCLDEINFEIINKYEC